ncbi:hypothetical protein [Priestia megaterium]|uniref:hypothetical protein n=1 Tax=Priestia megaterium TaxID=1404 RepID=UPI00207A2922|nr:hypothetical protein [Priestia megaterium]USL34826.1 hypothetical protein LIT34_18725 [Priestia megaterium]
MSYMKKIVTFGASSRIENKTEEFEELKEQYKLLYERMEQKRIQLNEELNLLVEEKVEAIKSLKKISIISNNIQQKKRSILYREFDGGLEQINFGLITETIDAGEMALNTAKGASAGVSSALGAWALVSTLGTASTGTAIGTLSGAAATNATLAWFGGGALAAGGGGMAAGTVILGGIVVIPALTLVGVFNHVQANKKIKGIEKQMNEVVGSIDQLQANILKIELITKRSREILVSLQKTRNVFDSEIEKVYKIIYPTAVISKSIKWTKKNLIGQNYFSTKDLEQIQYIGSLATDFAMLIDTKIFEE